MEDKKDWDTLKMWGLREDSDDEEKDEIEHSVVKNDATIPTPKKRRQAVLMF